MNGSDDVEGRLGVRRRRTQKGVRPEPVRGAPATDSAGPTAQCTIALPGGYFGGHYRRRTPRTSQRRSLFLQNNGAYLCPAGATHALGAFSGSS